MISVTPLPYGAAMCGDGGARTAWHGGGPLKSPMNLGSPLTSQLSIGPVYIAYKAANVTLAIIDSIIVHVCPQ